jgi:hypothetical protein
MLFKVCARYIPNRTRRDGSALLARMVGNASPKRAIRGIYGRTAARSVTRAKDSGS